MKKILYACVIIALLASCAESYSVQGSSSISSLDGSKLYLKAIKNNELKNIDSCEVIHGQFRFAGLLDSVRMANLFMDDHSIMPIVLEQGEISIRIDIAKQSVAGTPLNDRLYEFIDFHTQLQNELNELQHKENQMLLEGIDEMTARQQTIGEANVIAQREDSLVTHFIIENFDNVLGPGVFMMLTSGYPYPVLTPQIEEIMSKATASFKNDPYVKDYYRIAQENQARQTGLTDDISAAPTQPVQQIDTTVADSLPQLQPQVPITNVPQQ